MEPDDWTFPPKFVNHDVSASIGKKKADHFDNILMSAGVNKASKLFGHYVRIASHETSTYRPSSSQQNEKGKHETGSEVERKSESGETAYLCASINSFIHILMYSYYFLSAMGPHMQKYLWWKRYMTALQLVQFWWILIHTLSSIYISCFNNGYNWALVLYVLSHILLFTNFYIQTYTKKRTKQSEATANGTPNGLISQREAEKSTRHRTRLAD